MRDLSANLVEKVIGYKWIIRIIAQIRNGLNRPGKIRRAIPGLTTKVMNERFTRLVYFGILRRKVFQESSPQHVEYHFTPFGKALASQLAVLEKFMIKHSNKNMSNRPPATIEKSNLFFSDGK